MRTAKYPKLEEALYMWYSEMRLFKAPINDEMLIKKAEYFSQMLIDENNQPIIDKSFKFSIGWIAGFRKRYSITFKNLHGEGGSCEATELQKYRAELKLVTEKYLPSDIFNTDELALFPKLLPNRTLADKNNRDERGEKVNIERITVCGYSVYLWALLKKK